jgi:hypothetical protein
MPALPETADTGILGVMHLKRAWARARDTEGRSPRDPMEGHRDRLVFHALGLGLEQAIQRIGGDALSFEAFENWILEVTGGVPAARIGRINAAMLGLPPPPEVAAWLASIDAMDPVLSAEDLAFWHEHGYVVVHDAVPEDTRLAALDAVLALRGARLDEPESWYKGRQSIMIQAFQHAAFDANRRAPRVHKAYAQLWGSADLWVTTDRVGFNAPEREGWTFQGPDLHWDISLARPVGFHTQGVLYLTDTTGEQGAFTCVPGFHRRIEGWLDSLPAGADPRAEDLHALGSRPIAGRAGDLIIWHDALPHGSRPNRGTAPRIVQYIAMYPFAPDLRDQWV